MLAQSPDGHLIESGDGEEPRDRRVGHDREAKPGQDLVGIIGTRDEVEQPRERVGRG